MRTIWKGTISFGLVNIPIALGLATQRSDPKFRTLDRESLQPIRQQLFSPARGETVAREDTVKGFEVGKDRFLTVTDEELESLQAERRRSIDIEAFVDLSDVDPVYFDRTYYLQPQDNAEKPYALLLQAMKDTGKAAVGKIVLSSKEYLALLRPAGDALAVELLFYPEDVRPKDEIEDQVRGTDLKPAELEMAKQLVESLSRPFEPGEYENEHKREFLALVERKLAGEDVVVVADEPELTPVPDLMSALKASLEQAKGSRRSGAKAAANGGSTASAPPDGADRADGAPSKPKRAPRKKAPAKAKDGPAPVEA
jgi:DNA end-binding protein Ku